MKKTISAIAQIAVIAGLCYLFAKASESDAQHAKADQAHYCQNVASGTWPDYKGNYKKVCQ